MLKNAQIEVSLPNCRACKSRSIEVCSARYKFPLYIWPLPEMQRTILKDIHVYICNDCGYMQLQNMDDETISEIYRDEAFNVENREEKYERLTLLTADDKQKFEKTKALEVGGGRNTFLGLLPDSSEKWVADFNVDKIVQSEVDGVFIGDFVDADITESDFDYIFMFHVLEHFNDPSMALKKAKRLLNSQGKIIIEVPNFGLESELRPHYTIFHMHISLFTEISLMSLMMRHGFSCVDVIKKDEVLLVEFRVGDSTLPQNHIMHSLEYLSIADSNIKKCYSKLDALFNKIENGAIAIFGGGGASTLFLCNYPFLIDRVSFAIDSDKGKIGRSLCNGRIPIVSPDGIINLNIKHVIVLEKSHIDYVDNDEVNYINIGAIYES